MELQRVVLIEGGAYWDAKMKNGNRPEVTSDRWQRLSQAKESSTISETINSEQTTGTSENFSESEQSSRAEHRRSRFTRQQKRQGLAALVALGLFLAVGLWWNHPSSPNWGFGRTALLTADVSRSEYLLLLADAADDWFNQRPETRNEVLHRLHEFEQGCETLLQASHPQLPAADREWLFEKYSLWKGKLESHQAELVAGRISTADALAAGDETVRTLQKALRERAGQEVS